jgi:hypothetical protein
MRAFTSINVTEQTKIRFCSLKGDKKFDFFVNELLDKYQTVTSRFSLRDEK